MASRRSRRVERLLRDAVSEIILQDLVDPRMGFVTVTKVEVSPDLKLAKVFVSIIGDDAVISRTFEGLGHAAGFVQRRVVDKVELRSAPRVRFVLDDSVKKSVRISELLRRARASGVEGDKSETS